jgi:flagellar hook-associated protein 3 FlgL
MTDVSTYSTMYMNLQCRFQVARQEKQLADLGQELSTGLKYDPGYYLTLRTAQSVSERTLRSEVDQYRVSSTMLANKMDSMASALDSAGKAGTDMMALVAQNLTQMGSTATQLQMVAQARIRDVCQAMNSTYQGEYLFAGINAGSKPLNEPSDVSPVTGQTPMQAMQSVVTGPPANPAAANAMITEIDKMFSDTATVPANNYEQTFYGGTPTNNPGTGLPNPRVTARPDSSTVMQYGVQANDPGFRHMLEGMYMLASVDVSKITDTTTYQIYMSKVMSELTQGNDAVTLVQTTLGTQQEQVKNITTSQQQSIDLIDARLTTVEGADPYETQAKYNALETQIQASYSVTAKLGKLTLLNYLQG